MFGIEGRDRFIVLFLSIMVQGVVSEDRVRNIVRKNLKAEHEMEIAKDLLNQSKTIEITYNSLVRPRGQVAFRMVKANNRTETKYPTLINATMRILALSSFDDVKMEFTAQLIFQQEWIEPRLRHNKTKNTTFIRLGLDQEIWRPDTFFQNEQEVIVHVVDQPNHVMMFRSDGFVRYHKRLTMTFSCPMNLLYFPHDSQSCVIEFASYAYTTDDIILQWSPTPILYNYSNTDAPKFSVVNLRKDVCTSTTLTGSYSCLRIKLRLRREFSYFFLQLYIPSCMLVSVSCVSFWIDWRSAPARVPLNIVTLLTVITQAHAINAVLPPVSYTKAIDIWIGACVLFVFGALIEFAIVHYIGNNAESKKFTRSFVRRSTINNNNYYSLPNCPPNLPPNIPAYMQQKTYGQVTTTTTTKFGSVQGYGVQTLQQQQANFLIRRADSMTGYIPPMRLDAQNSLPPFAYRPSLASGRELNYWDEQVERNRPQIADQLIHQRNLDMTLHAPLLTASVSVDAAPGVQNRQQSHSVFDHASMMRFHSDNNGSAMRVLESAEQKDANYPQIGGAKMPPIMAKSKGSAGRRRRRRIQQEIEVDAAATPITLPGVVDFQRDDAMAPPPMNVLPFIDDDRPRSTAERIDIMARILFPIGFILFNIAYWSTYLPRSYDEDD